MRQGRAPFQLTGFCTPIEPTPARLDEGIYVTGFYYPVVPKGQARIRVQVSAGHTRAHLDKCVEAFTKIGKELGVLK